MKTYLFTYCLALLAATGLTPLVTLWAGKRGLVDKPGIRKIHSAPIARVGGIAIFAGVMLAILPVLAVQNAIGEFFRARAAEVVVIMASSVVIFLVGLYDDLKQARISTKLGVEILATLFVMSAGIHVDVVHIRNLPPINLGAWGYIVTFIWIIGITNAINLIDGLDGLAAGISAIACGVMAALSIWQGNVMLAIIMLALLGSLTGFLLYNFHPAKIFMGDGGSLFLGFVIASSSVLTASQAEALVGIGLPILVLGIPIFDTLFCILRRVSQRRGIMSPDNGHFHHRLLELGLKQHHVAIVAYMTTFGLTALGLFMLLTHSTGSIVVFLACLSLLLVVFRMAGIFDIKKTYSDIVDRVDLAHMKRVERRQFEEAQLYFKDAQTFDQWWECVCRAAKILEFSSMSLELAMRDDETQTLAWQRNGDSQNDTDEHLEDILSVKVPIGDRRIGKSPYIDIQILSRGSLESAGRRIALFGRLADEFGLDGLPKVKSSLDVLGTLEKPGKAM
jgi:UDP-GlcNAc:undecaprenyl-phosphate/decaprenyl-phosphate GlcNAc-1-phosphate transferase